MRKYWTKEEIELLEKLYADTPTKKLAEILGRTERSVYGQAFGLGMKKSEEYIKKMLEEGYSRLTESGKVSRFKKGQIPFNKGVKQKRYMNPEAIEKTKKTRFKKGYVPKNTAKIGTEVFTKDGYIKIKVAHPNKWKLKHRQIWEQKKGKIPKGYNVQFKDGNKTNTNLENLYIISRAEQMLNQNSIINQSPEIRHLVRTKAILSRAINKHIKREENEQ